jgi:glycosyltransferase involved in cell wall biosynthesis
VTQRLVILTEIISPYRIPLFNALARRTDVDLHVIFLAETDPSLRQWRIYKDEIEFSYQVLPSWRKRVGRYNWLLNRGVGSALSAADPDVILCGGYSYIASWQALVWARIHSVPLFLWSESNLQDVRSGQPLVEFLKKEFLTRCSGFVVPGKSAREYLIAQKIKDSLIFTAPNAVDNDLFAGAAAGSRQNAARLRKELNLPNRYFLFVGRFVPEKGVFDLLSAYARLDKHVRSDVGLVFVGDGVSRGQMEEQARSISPGAIRLAGFAQREQLAAYYGLAEALILPTYTDPWGLVVNEAMACGLPVIVSRVAGCAADLVRDNWNGWLISPGDVPSLAAVLDRLGTQPDLRVKMGANSSQHIAQYSAEAWSAGIARPMSPSANRD